MSSKVFIKLKIMPDKNIVAMRIINYYLKLSLLTYYFKKKPRTFETSQKSSYTLNRFKINL